MVYQIISQCVVTVETLELPGSDLHLTKQEVGPRRAFPNIPILESFQPQTTLIFDYHVVHDNTCHHDVRNSLQVTLPHGVLYNLPTSLEHTESFFYILPCFLLAFREVFFHGTLWFVDGLYKACLGGIYSIREKIKPRVLVPIHLKVDVISFAS